METIEKKNLYQRLSAIMSDLDYIQRGEKRVNNQYQFVSHDQVTAAIHPLLVKHGVMAIPTVLCMEQQDNRTIAKVATTFINIDNPEDVICNTFYGYGIDPGDKGPGKAISYAFKYAILKTFCLETGDDPDNDQNSVYEPLNSEKIEFELPIDMDMNKRERINTYLEYSSKETGKSIEKLKRGAAKKMDDFLAAFEKWDNR